MRAKFITLILIFVLAFTINVNAVDVQVPAGNRPLPGADSSIPENAYEIYTTGGQQQESTVVLVHDSKNRFKFTAPERSLGGQYKLEEGKNNRGFGIISTENGVLLYKAQQSTPDRIISDDKNGEFLYPKIDKGIWAITSDERLGTTYFIGTRFSNQTDREYTAGYIRVNKSSDLSLTRESLMANYVLPSMQSIDGLDAYSHSESWANLIYKVPNSAKLDSDIVKYGSFDRKIYRDQNLIIFVDKTKNVYPKDDFYNFKGVISNFENSRYTPYASDDRTIQYATVWNNGRPGLLIDQYNPNKLSVLSQAYFDKMHLYYITIEYIDGKAPYTHMQLRNMIEYLDFKNLNEYIKKPAWLNGKVPETLK